MNDLKLIRELGTWSMIQSLVIPFLENVAGVKISDGGEGGGVVVVVVVVVVWKRRHINKKMLVSPEKGLNSRSWYKT